MNLKAHYSGSFNSADGHTYTIRLLEDTQDAVTEKSIEIPNAVLSGGRKNRVYPALVPSHLEIEIISDDDAGLKALSAKPESSIFMDLQRDGTALWRGYLVPDFWDRALGRSPFKLSLRANLGFDRLKNFTFDPVADGWANEMTDRMRMVDAIAYCLSKIRSDATMNIITDKYPVDTAGNVLTSGDPLADVEMQLRRAYDIQHDASNRPDTREERRRRIAERSGEDYEPNFPAEWTCHEALVALCHDTSEKGAWRQISFYDNQWWVVDHEMRTAPADTHQYDIAGTSAAFQQTITTQPDSYVLPDNEHWVDGVREGQKGAVSQAKVIYDHGEVPNLIPYGELDRWENGEPVGWVAQNGADASFTPDNREGGFAAVFSIPDFEVDRDWDTWIAGEPHYKQEARFHLDVQGGDRLAFEAEVASGERTGIGAAKWIDDPRALIYFPYALVLDGDSGTTHYFTDLGPTLPGRGTASNVAAWTDSPSGTAVLAGRAPVGERGTIGVSELTDPVPEDGTLYAIFGRPFEPSWEGTEDIGDSLMQKGVWKRVEAYPVDGSGERQTKSEFVATVA